MRTASPSSSGLKTQTGLSYKPSWMLAGRGGMRSTDGVQLRVSVGVALNPGRMSRSGSRPATAPPKRIRRAVVGVEIAMTYLGALVTAGVDPVGGQPAGFIALAALTGRGLSLAAALGSEPLLVRGLGHGREAMPGGDDHVSRGPGRGDLRAPPGAFHQPG